MHARTSLLVLVAASALLTASCTPEPAAKEQIKTKPVFPVKGTVNVNGAVDDKVRIEFYNKASVQTGGSLRYTGRINPDGTVDVKAFSDAAGPGIPEGEYLVTFYKPEAKRSLGFGGGDDEPIDLFGDKYRDPAASQFNYVAGPSASNDLGTINLEVDEAAVAAEKAKNQ